MTLQLLHSELPYTVYEENLIFLSVYFPLFYDNTWGVGEGKLSVISKKNYAFCFSTTKDNTLSL
jgi:hypothetical protein